ncbi:MAG: ElyC/SanA/YdcF family protein [Prosthecobacter sp.]|nr:ElyC/SanA/YdcF family protein [Prosthecobacter sp.]
MLTASLVILLWGSNAWVKSTAAGRCHTQPETVPAMPAALVLGCSPKLQGGGINLFFTARIQAAAALFKAQKVRALIVSGDNGRHNYDEPTAMQEALIAAGMPGDRIYCDYAGFRTLDSVVRASAIFGQKRFVVVSQHYHNERALFLARQHGLEAVALDARDVPRAIALLTYLREYLARVQAVLDVTLLNTQPKFYGPPVLMAQEP